jgi:hypothetical protein
VGGPEGARMAEVEQASGRWGETAGVGGGHGLRATIPWLG